jgi:hypothetical protein
MIDHVPTTTPLLPHYPLLSHCYYPTATIPLLLSHYYYPTTTIPLLPHYPLLSHYYYPTTTPQEVYDIVYFRMWGLKQVRHAVKEEGKKLNFITDEMVRDCEVSEFIEGPCSSSCDEERVVRNVDTNHETTPSKRII